MGDGVAPAVPALRSVLLNHPGVWLRAREKESCQGCDLDCLLKRAGSEAKLIAK